MILRFWRQESKLWRQNSNTGFQNVALNSKSQTKLEIIKFLYHSKPPTLYEENFQPNFLTAPSLFVKTLNHTTHEGCPEYFFQTPMPNSPEVSAQTPPHPPQFTLKRYDFDILAPKIKMLAPKFEYLEPKCGAKFKFHKQNSNSLNFVTLKTCRFERKNLPTQLI